MSNEGEYINRVVKSDTIFMKSGEHVLEVRSEIAHCPICEKLTMFVDDGNGVYECSLCTMVK